MKIDRVVRLKPLSIRISIFLHQIKMKRQKMGKRKRLLVKVTLLRFKLEELFFHSILKSAMILFPLCHRLSCIV